MRRRSVSHIIALGVLALDALGTVAVLYLCDQAVRRDFTGSLPYLTALIGAMQAATAVVLTAYFGKSRAENTQGGIVYDAALGQEEIDA